MSKESATAIKALLTAMKCAQQIGANTLYTGEGDKPAEYPFPVIYAI